MYLYYYSGIDYFDSFAHELIHALRVYALRINEIPYWDSFFEEGFASTISKEVFNGKKGFPLFGYDRKIITAYFAQRDDFIDLNSLRENHQKFNRSCQLQSYIPREDFFCFLKDEYGLGPLVRYANSELVGQVEGYEEFWGKPFHELEELWLTQLTLLDQKEVIRMGESFLQSTPIKFMPI